MPDYGDRRGFSYSGRGSQGSTSGRGRVGAGHSSHDRPGGGGGQQSQGNRARHANEFAGISATMQAENERRAKQEKENARLAAKAQAERLEANRQQRQQSGTSYQNYLDKLTRHTDKTGFSWYEEEGVPWNQRRDEQLRSAFGGYGGYDTPSGYLWDSLSGLSEADKNSMWRYGEFDTWQPSTYYGGGGGGGGWGGYGGSGGYGGGGGGGGYGYAEEDFMPRGNPNEAWGSQNPLQQMMISMHGGKGFQQGYDRGGIVGLVR